MIHIHSDMKSYRGTDMPGSSSHSYYSLLLKTKREYRIVFPPESSS